MWKVAFNTREHAKVFDYVVKIYIEMKAMHGGIRPIPIILANDETEGKSHITWEVWSYGLMGFYGLKDNHNCVSSYKP